MKTLLLILSKQPALKTHTEWWCGSTRYWSRHWMETSGQLRAPSTLPRGKESPVHVGYESVVQPISYYMMHKCRTWPLLITADRYTWLPKSEIKDKVKPYQTLGSQCMWRGCHGHLLAAESQTV